MSVSVLGAGAFGTALAISLAGKGPVTLWARDAGDMAKRRENTKRLPGCPFPDTLTVTDSLDQASAAKILLLAVPMQRLRSVLEDHKGALHGKHLVACCKGIELSSGVGPVSVITQTIPDATAAILTGPSFAADIARGLPTALTLACGNAAAGKYLQAELTTANLRLYRTTDTIGAVLGGALKNVVAIARGVVIGAGLGDSARAAIVTRGFAEMTRFATALGARSETLTGLSGLGDLILTCTSPQSRNFRFGQAMGRGEDFDPTITVEGAATARAVSALASREGTDMPIAGMVAALASGAVSVEKAADILMNRPLKEE